MKDFINKVKDKFKKNPKEETSEQKRLRLLEEEKKAATKAKKPWVAVLNTHVNHHDIKNGFFELCLLYTSPSPRDATLSRMPSSA